MKWLKNLNKIKMRQKLTGIQNKSKNIERAIEILNDRIEHH